MPDARPIPVQALSRGLRILELLGQADDGLSLQQAARAAGLKPPTTHNLLRTLQAHGFAERAEHPVRYRLGAAVARLAERFASRPLLRAAAAELLRLAAGHAGGQFLLAERLGGQVVASLVVEPEAPTVVRRPRGKLLGAYSSASGLAVQAFGGQEDRAALVLAHPFWEEASGLWRSPLRL
jgi:DNA-binding IclR family transcriptional regulator